MATARSVLVVTATAEFGMLIQNQLEQTGLYKVMVVDSDKEALLCIQTVAFSLAILDADLPGESMLGLASIMRHRLPRMRLLFICAEDDPVYSTLNAFNPAGLLSKSFYNHELLDTLAMVYKSPSGTDEKTTFPKSLTSESVHASMASPEWLDDARWAARNLAQLSLESSAQAALIVRDGAIWAYAGELLHATTDELVEWITSTWNTDKDPTSLLPHQRKQLNDMVRFIHLDATQGEYMLYTTSLGDDNMVLSLVFETETPFSTIRAQASNLARVLCSQMRPSLPAESVAVLISQISQRENPTTNHQIQPLESVLSRPPDNPRQLETRNDRTSGWFLEAATPFSLGEALDHKPTRTDEILSNDHLVPTPETDNIHPTPTSSATLYLEQNQHSPDKTILNSPVTIQTALVNDRPEVNPRVDGNSPMSKNQLSTSLGLHYLIYSCTLLPRLPNHKLEGDLARQLREWIPQLFLAFGWQFVDININPEYLQVIVRTNPSTSPGAMVRIIRHQTSNRIFAAFPRLSLDNPSNDFWAIGYLIMSSSQAPPAQVIRRFIEQVRIQQGVNIDK